MIARKIELERMQDEIRRKQEEKLKQERIKFMKNLDKNCTITSDPSEVDYFSFQVMDSIFISVPIEKD